MRVAGGSVLKQYLAPLALAVGLLTADASLACCVTSGQITAWDRDKQLIQLADGSIYYVPNTVWFWDLRPRRWVVLWYRERDGVRVIWNHSVKNRRKRAF